MDAARPVHTRSSAVTFGSDQHTLSRGRRPTGGADTSTLEEEREPRGFRGSSSSSPPSPSPRVRVVRAREGRERRAEQWLFPRNAMNVRHFFVILREKQRAMTRTHVQVSHHNPHPLFDKLGSNPFDRFSPTLPLRHEPAARQFGDWFLIFIFFYISVHGSILLKLYQW